MFALACAMSYTHAIGQNLIITGIIDGPYSGGLPKAIELYATDNIADLSVYAVGSANNGGGSDGVEFTLSGAATSGQFLYVATEVTEFTNWFGFAPDLTTSVVSVNGDDAIELFYDASGSFSGAETVIDVFGEITYSGSVSWSYLDGWAYRNSNTGPDGSTFVESNWSFSGANALDPDGAATNATSSSPFPTGTFSLSAPDVTPPDWESGYPFINSTSTTSFDLVGQLDEDGTIYYVIVADGESAPSSSEVATASAPGTVLFSGNSTATGGVDATLSVSGLTAATAYDVYVVAEDDEPSPNLQASPTLLSFPVPEIVITEFLNDPIGTETTDEWIELYNRGSGSVDLTGWTISDEGSDSDVIGSVSIAANDFLILAKSKSIFETQWLGGSADARVVEVSGITLANGADEIVLSDATSKVVWSLAYGSDGSSGRATFLSYSDNFGTNVFGSASSPGVVSDGDDSSGSIGYEDNSVTTDSEAFTSTTGDVGSPLAAAFTSVLPVELVRFDVEITATEAHLLWTTASETNNAGFRVEKSLDGKTFVFLGYVEGEGNTSRFVDYDFSDTNFYQTSFYRLQQIDFDGKATYSAIVRAEMNKSVISIVPNPLNSHVSISFPETSFQMKIVDMAGRILFNNVTSRDLAGNTLLGLIKGVYMVSLQTDHIDFTTKLVKQ